MLILCGMSMMQIPSDRLSNLAQAKFQRGGSSEVEANQVSEDFDQSYLFDHDSHGASMVPGEPEQESRLDLRRNDIPIDKTL